MEFNFQSKSNADLSEFEEILRYQQSGRRLSAMQMQRLNDYVSRRFSLSSLAGEDIGMRRFSLDLGPMNDPNFWLLHGNDSIPDPVSSVMPQLISNGNDSTYDPRSSVMQRRRSSAIAMQNLFNEYGLRDPAMNDFHNVSRTTNAAEQSNRVMEKKTSLDLLGDVAAARSFESNILNSPAKTTDTDTQATDTDAKATGNESKDLVVKKVDSEKIENVNIGISPSKQSPSKESMNNVRRQPMNRRSTLDMILNSQGTFGDRRSSLSFILGQDFYPLSRSNSMALGNMSNDMKFIPPYEMSNLYEFPLPFNDMLMNDMAKNDPYASQSSVLDHMMLQQRQQNNPSFQDLQFLASQQDFFRRQSLEMLLHGTEYNFAMSQNNKNEKNEQMVKTPKRGSKKASSSSLISNPTINSEPLLLDYDSIPTMNLESIKTFTKTMKKSQESQFSIQVWDKKMGLKRSHSATMTKTTRSRKALRELFERICKKLQQQNKEISPKGKKRERDTA